MEDVTDVLNLIDQKIKGGAIKEVIVWADGCDKEVFAELSGDDGKFRITKVGLSYTHEHPCINFAGRTSRIDNVRKATASQIVEYVSIETELRRLRLKRDALKNAIFANGERVSWGWLVDHTVNEVVPVPYASRLKFTALRKGTRVKVKKQQYSSKYSNIEGKVGKVVKKRTYEVDVLFSKTQYSIPYKDLEWAKPKE